MTQTQHKQNKVSTNAQTVDRAPVSSASDLTSQATEQKKTNASSPVLFFMLWFGIPMLLIIGLAMAMGRS